MERKKREGNVRGNGCGRDRLGVELAHELQKPRTKRDVISSLLEAIAKRGANIGKSKTP